MLILQRKEERICLSRKALDFKLWLKKINLRNTIPQMRLLSIFSRKPMWLLETILAVTRFWVRTPWRILKPQKVILNTPIREVGWGNPKKTRIMINIWLSPKKELPSARKKIKLGLKPRRNWIGYWRKSQLKIFLKRFKTLPPKLSFPISTMKTTMAKKPTCSNWVLNLILILLVVLCYPTSVMRNVILSYQSY